MANYPKRLNGLQKAIQDHNADAILIEHPVNLFYLTGQQFSTASLLVHTKGACLLADNRYYEVCKKNLSIPVVLSDQTSLKQLLSSEEFGFIKTLGFDSENTSYKRFEELSKFTIDLKPFEDPVKNLRMIKDEEEIQLLKEAADLGSQGFDYICSLLKEGITEIELAQELEIFWKRKGGSGVAFDPIIAFGPNSSMPHYRAGNDKLFRGKHVLIDIGVNYHHYHSDMTRIVFFGEPDPKIVEIFHIVEKAQLAAIALCRPGFTMGEIDNLARGHIMRQGYGDYFKHGLGHGVGLEIHEAPTIRNKAPFKDMLLQPGMVITIEPGIYLPGIGGIRIEDTIVITEDKNENLTKRSTRPVII